MRKYMAITVALILAVGLMQSVSFADKGAGYHHGGHGGKHSLKGRFFNRAQLIYLNQEELNINDKQLDEIKGLKNDLKRDLIRKKAELDLIRIDINTLLSEDVVDVKAINDLLDKKYEIKKSKMKKLVSSYAQLKKILTMEQNEKLMDIYYGQRKMGPSKGSPRRGMYK